MQKTNDLKTILVFSIVVAVISIIIGGYAFGIGDHIEQLPPVLRAADSSYLSNDFFTNASSTIGPRYFFSHFIGYASRYIQLEVVYFILTALAKFSIAFVTMLFVREISQGSLLAGMVCVSFIFVTDGFNLGDASELRFLYLTPHFLALPLIMGILLSALQGNILLSSFIAGIASLIHPTLGLETGALALAAYFIANLIPRNPSQSKDKPKPYRNLMGSVLIFGAFAGLWWLIFQSNERIPDITFIDILVYFRHPHHYVPSMFPISDYLFTAIFILNLGIAWVFWRSNPILSNKIRLFVISFIGLIFAACAAGYVFVEIIPTRVLISAQVFRLLLIFKWLGFGVIAANIGSSINGQHATLSESDGYLLLVGGISPILMLFIQVVLLLRSFWINKTSRLSKHLQSTGPLFLTSVLIGAIFISSGFSGLDTRSIAAFLILLLIAFIMRIWLPEGRKAEILTLSITLGFVLFLYLIPWILPPYYDNYVRGLRPELGMESRLDGELALVGDFARNNLPDDAVLITHPSKGEMRLIADRAIVVDYKAFPFSDLGMLEWRHRLFDLYGKPNSEGYQVEWEMEQLYSQISDAKLLENAKKYGACYAILYSSTGTQFRVLFSTNTYELVEIPGCGTTN